MDAAILAGGRARRLGGRDKCSLLVGQASILDRQLAVLRGLAERVVIVGGQASPARELGVELVADLIPNAGALGGIYSALSAATSEHVLVLACDLPFLSPSLLGRLAALADVDCDVVIPRAPDGLQPLCAVYARRLAVVARRQIESGRLKVLDLVSAVRAREIGPDEIDAIDPGGRPFFNVNTPRDLKEAIRLAAHAARPWGS